MKKKIKKDKVEPYKISATIYTDEELEELDHKIGNDLDNIINQVTDAVLTKRELIVLQKVIEKQQKEIESRLEEIDNLYKMMSAKDDEIEKLKEDYQILKDDIEGHNVVYVDTPEFEENYISKDKIKEKIEKIKEDEEFYRERDRMYEFNGKINILKELLGETNE